MEIEKDRFYCHEGPLFQEMLLLRKYYYLLRFLLVKKAINTLLVTCMMIIMPPKTSGYVNIFDGQNKWMYSFNKGNLLGKHNVVWNKINDDTINYWIVSLSTIKNFLKTKIKSYGDEVTAFYDKETPKVNSDHTCLAVISLDSLKKLDQTYY